VYKVYDTAQTPYQRLIRSGLLAKDKKRDLADMYRAWPGDFSTTNQTIGATVRRFG